MSLTSFSQNNLFSKCARWWWYAYIKKIPTIQDMCYANAGTIIHKILEIHYSGEKDIEKLKEEFNRLWNHYKLPTTKLRLKNDLYWSMVLNGIALKKELTSTEFKILLEDAVAYIDGLNSQTDEILDWKSSTISEDNKIEYSTQLKFYSYLYHRKFGRIPKKASVYYLKYNGSKSELSINPTTQDLLEIEDWHMDIRKRMQTVRVENKIPPKCEVCDYWCPYKNLCSDSSDILRYTLRIFGNYIQLDGIITNILDKQLTRKFSYELKNAHFIKKAKPMANTTIKFWNLNNRTLPLGFKDGLVKTLNDYAKWRKKEIAIDIDDMRTFDDTEVKMPDKFLNGITLRDYQDESVTAFFRKEVGGLQIGTGGGKTNIAAECVRRASCKTLFIVDKIELLTQTKKRFEEMLGIPIGQIGNGEDSIENVTIGTMQTIAKNIKKYSAYLSTVKFVIFDECFVSRTYILTEKGTITLGRLFMMYQRKEELPKVLTLNEKTGIYEYKKILKVLQKENENLLKIDIGRRNIKVTYNHLFLTQRGWIKAIELTNKDLLYSYKIEKNRNDNAMNCLNPDQLQIIYGSFLGDGSLDLLPSKNYRMRFTHGITQKQYLDWKLKIFSEKRIKNTKSGYTGNPIYRGQTKSFNMCETFISKNICPNWLLDKISAKGIAVWFMDDGTLNKRSNASIIHSNSFDYDEHIKFKNMFKKRYNIDVEIKLAKNKYYYLYFKKIESIKLHKLIDKYIHPTLEYKKIFDTTFESDWNSEFLNYGHTKIVAIKKIKNKYGKKIQSKPYVYDLSVEDNHNYIITSNNKKNGIVVHNCHHAASRSIWKIGNHLTNTKYRLGLSATIRRDDGNDLMVHAIIGDIFHNVSSETLIKQGWLVKPTVTFIKNYMPKEQIAITEQKCKVGLINEVPNYANFYNGFISENQWRNNVIKSLVDKHSDKKILILTKLIEHGKALQLIVPKSKHLYGETDKEVRAEMMDEFKNGDLKVMISTVSIWAEGLDMPSLDVIINASANAGDIRTVQILGRVLRTLDGKKNAHYYDFEDEHKFFRLASISRKKILRDEGHNVQVIDPPKPLTIIEARKFSAIEMEHKTMGIIKKVRYDDDKEELVYVSYRNKTHVMRMFQGLGMSIAILDKLKKQNIKKIIIKYEQMTGNFEYYLSNVEDFYNSPKERAYDMDKQKFLSFDELKSNMIEVSKEINL